MTLRRGGIGATLGARRFALSLLFLLLLASTSSAQVISYGETLTGSLSVAGEVDTYTFTATAGDVVLIRLAETANTFEPRVRLLRSGTVEMEDTWGYALAELDAIHLAMTTTYTIVVSDQGSDEAGDYALHLQRLDLPSGATSTSYGDDHAGSVSQAAQSLSYRFDASTGDRLLACLTRETSSFTPQLRLYDSSGDPVVRTTGNPTAMLESTVLPDSGPYTLLVLASSGTAQGDYELRLQCLNDPSGAPSLSYGQTLTGSWSHVADFQSYRITASAGDRLFLRCTETESGTEPQLRLYDPAGDPITNTWSYTTAELDAIEIVTSGIYTLVALDYNADEMAGFVLHAQNTASPASATGLTWGNTVGGDVTTRAVTVPYTFVASAGDRLLLRMVRELPTLTPRMRVYGPDGEPLSSPTGTPLAELDAWVAPSTGTYAILAHDNAGSGTGAFQIHAQRLNDPGSAVNIAYGETHAGLLTQLAETRTYRFTASAGDRIVARATETASVTEPQLRLYDPDGDLITSTWNYTSPILDAVELTEGGTHTLAIMDYSGDEVAGFSIHLQRTHSPVGATALSWGTTSPGDVAELTQSIPYTFTATAGDRVFLRMAREAPSLTPLFKVYDPNGELLVTRTGTPLAEIDPLVIPSSGSYAVLSFDSAGSGNGPFRIYAQRLNDPGMATLIDFDDTVFGSLPTVATAAAYRFAANAGDRVLLRQTEVGSPTEPNLRLYDASGEPITTTWSYTTAILDAIEIPATANYTVLAGDYSADETGDFWLHLQRTNDPANVVDLSYGGVTAGNLAQRAQSKAYRIQANAGDRVLLNMTRDVTTLGPRLSLYASDGSSLGHWTGTPTASANSFLLEATGDFHLLTTDSAGSGTGDFVVHVQRLNDPGDARPITYMQTRSDSLTSIAQTRAFPFNAGSGDSVTIRVTEHLSATEPAIRLYDPSGVQLATTWNYTTATLGYRVGPAGTYTILVYDYSHDETGGFDINLNGHVVAVPGRGDVVSRLVVHPAHPNPFNPATVLAFEVPRAGHVVLDVYALDGRRVARLADRVFDAGLHRHVWRGCDSEGKAVASGVYLYEVRAGTERSVRKMVLLR